MTSMSMILAIGLAVLGGGSGPAVPAAVSQNVDYRYCLLSTPPYGETVYFSSVFAVEGGTYAVGIQNRFNAFVAARHDPRTFSGSICLGPYSTRGEADEARDNEIGQRRRDGKTVIVTRWRFAE